MKTRKENQQPNLLKQITIVLGGLFILFLFIFDIPGAIPVVNNYNNQLNNPWKEQTDKAVGVTFQYPSSWVIQNTRGASNIPDFMSNRSKCTGAKPKADHLFVKICSNPDTKAMKPLLENHPEFVNFGGTKYLKIAYGNDYQVGRALISADMKYWMEFDYSYLSDSYPFTNSQKDKILTRIANSVRNLDQ